MAKIRITINSEVTNLKSKSIMRSIYFLNILFLISICTGCTNYSKELPKDFSFEIKDEVDSYNSKSGLFTRRAINEKFKDTTVTYSLSQKDKEEIYRVFKDNDIVSIPKSFECASNAQFMMPAFTTTLKYRIGGIQKEIVFNTSCFPKKNQNDEVRFDNITEFIRNKLDSKEIIKKIPKTKARFM